MPRARRPEVAPGEDYGQRQELEQLAASGPVVQGPDLHATAVQQASAMEPPPPGGLLGQPTSRPLEPITAGLNVGAGPGPEAVPQVNRQSRHLAQQLQIAADMTGNPRIAAMARRIRTPPPPRNG